MSISVKHTFARPFIRFLNLCFFVVIPLWIGCSDGENDADKVENESATQSSLESSQSTVDALQGGTVALSGGALLSIPSGTLDTSVDVSLEQKSKPQGFAGDIYSDVYYVTAQARPRVASDFTLEIPYDPETLPEGTVEAALQAYALDRDGTYYPVSSQVDTARHVVMVANPRVEVFNDAGAQQKTANLASTPINQSKPSDSYGDPDNSTGYYVGPLAGPAICTNGTKGEVHEEAGHAFRIILKIDAPCEVVEFISQTLQDAYESHNARFSNADGWSPLGYFTPQNRMAVYIQTYPVNGEYKWFDWRGYFIIGDGAVRDAQKTEETPVIRNGRTLLRKTIFHELFHAVQDAYANMPVGGILAHWWFEATAEWAASASTGWSYSDLVQHEVEIYKSFLSIPMEETDDTNYYLGLGGKMYNRASYVYSLLVDYVEEETSGHVRDMLDGWSARSGTLYHSLAAAGNLTTSYADFVRQVMEANLPRQSFWNRGDIFEGEASMSVSRWRGSQIGDSDFSFTDTTNTAEREKDQLFSVTVPPLTTSFFTVRFDSALEAARTVDVSLTEKGAPSDSALIAKMLYTAAGGMGPAPVASITQLSSGGETIAGMGTDYQTLYIALFNSDSDNEKSFRLSVAISREAPAIGAVSSTFDFFDENWSIGPRADNFGEISGAGPPVHALDGGNPGGYIYHQDAGPGSYWYFRAPSKYYGDMSSLYGKKLTFDLKQTNEDPEVAMAPFVILKGSGLSICIYEVDPSKVGTLWTSYSYPLDSSAGWIAFTSWGSADHHAASPEEINAVLADLSDLRIRGEFTTGPDTGALDNVVLGSE